MEESKKTETKIKTNKIAMLTTNIAFSVLALFVSVFLVAQVFSLTDYSFMAVALFVLLDCAALFIFYFLASYLCKKIRPIWITRASVALACAFLVTLIFWSDGLRNFYILFGFIWGAVGGLHWGAMNYLVTNTFEGEKTKNYMTWFFGLEIAASIIFPFTFGLLIDFGSFYLTSIIVLVIGAIQLISTFIFSSPKREKDSFKIREFFKTLKEKKRLKLTFAFWGVEALSGMLRAVSFGLVLLVVLVFGSNISLGAFSSIAAVVGVVVLIIYKKLNKKIYWALGIVPLLTLIPLFFNVGFTTLVIFQFGIIFRTVVTLEESTARLNFPKKFGTEKYIAESHLFFESAFFVGRALSCVIVIIIALIGVTELLVVIGMAIMLIFFALHGILLRAWHSKVSKNEKMQNNNKQGDIILNDRIN
ncbi:MAG: MFS transporter [Firmicutes bacterium]|nr:MFS transporter [Bacillota bacterium]